MLKILKRIINCILGFIMLLCFGVLICAFNPSLTDKLKTQFGFSPSSVEITEIGGMRDPGNSGEYVTPPQTEVSSPEAVQGRNGYEPVRESAEEITDDEAQELQEKLQVGDAGKTLAFDTLFYPYYQMLSEDSQALYRQIYANALKGIKSFAPVVNVTVGEVTDAFEAVYNDHPELFWLETGYSCKYLQNGNCIEVTLQYHFKEKELAEAKEEFEDVTAEILAGAKKCITEKEKEKYVHDALMERVTYDAGADKGQSAYSALAEGESVCAGYARAFQYLCMKLGIPCYYCTGYSDGNHAWNIIRIDGAYYNVDVTWDDTEPATYDYFNRTDAEVANTHVRKSLSVYLPACGTKENAGTGTEGEGSDTGSLINPNPQQPLTWSDSEAKETDEKVADVLDTMDDYYADCKERMKEVGTGKKQFVNVVSRDLWKDIEPAYGDGGYWKGYVNDVLKEFELENFAMQLQVERINDGKYYRLYHNISTW